MITRRLRLERVPVRWKLTLASTALSAAALVGIAVAILAAFRSQLVSAIDADLHQRSAGLVALVRSDGPAAVRERDAEQLLRPQGAVAQVVRLPRTVVAASASAPAAPMVSGDGSRQRTAQVAGFAARARIVTSPVGRDGLVLAVARSLGDQQRADGSFGHALLVGAPLVLALVLAGSYAVSRLALAPVEQMRRRAAGMSASTEISRLPVPPARDELADLGTTLNDLLERVAEAAVRERAFIADASHELRTPLARLQAQMELALDADGGEAALRVALRHAHAEVQGLSSLAADLLTLAALSEQRASLAAGPTDLGELLAEVVASREDAARGAGRDLELDAEPLIVEADAGQLRQAVGNLIDNALVHGDGTVRVRAHTGADGRNVRVGVSDEGDGLDLALDEAIGRFTRGTRGRTRPGAGLGLALVNAVAAAHGGRVERGTAGAAEIVLILPRSGAAPAPGREPPDRTPAGPRS